MASSSTRSIQSFFRPQVLSSVIKAEALWTTFVVEHNLAFNASDHATKLFLQMFPNSKVAKKFACGRTKTAAIITEALAPHCCDQMLENLNKNCHFSLMMDESNDKKDKYCIILVTAFDFNIGDVRTRFLDMPIVNIGTAVNLFSAFKLSNNKKGLDFDKCEAFMSDTTNVMKGASLVSRS